MKLSKEEVEHVAMLARLGIDETEKEVFRQQLSQILTSFDSLKTLDAHPHASLSSASIHDPLREDTVVPSLSMERALMNAPKAEAGHFAVPKIMD